MIRSLTFINLKQEQKDSLTGGQFGAKQGGQFALKHRGQFKMKQGGHIVWNLHENHSIINLELYSSSVIFYKFICKKMEKNGKIIILE